MRRLKLKPTGNLSLQEIQYYNMRVSPDLSNISGRTSYYNGILNGELIKIVNNDNKFENVCKINSENVKVQGKALLKVELPIKTIEKEYEIDEYTYTVFESEGESKSAYTKNVSSVTKNYVEYKGVYSYEYDGKFVVNGKIYSLTSTADTSLVIDTFEYIEDGKVVINGEEYIVDFNSYFRNGSEPQLYESKYLTKLEPGTAISDSITYSGITDYATDKWKRETKFNVWKKENDELVIEDALFGAYEHNITYNGEVYTLSDIYDTIVVDNSGNTDVVYVGYGVWIDDKPYTIDLGSGTDDYLLGAALIIDDEYYNIDNTLVSPKNGGEMALFITKSEKISLNNGDTIIAKSNSSFKNILDVYELSGETPYVIYIDKRYEVKEGLFKYVTLSGIDSRLIDEGYNEEISAYTAYAFVGTDKIYFRYKETEEGTRAIPLNKIYYPIKDNENNFKEVGYGELEDGYEIEISSGVTIGDNVYRVYEKDENRITLDTEEGTLNQITHKYVEINEDAEYSFIVDGKNGSKTYMCYPSVDETDVFNTDDASAIRKYITDLVVRNKSDFTFYVRNDVFGESEIYPDTYLYDAAMAEKPFTTSEKLNISLYKINAYANVKFPIVNRIANDILREDIISHEYSDVIKGNSLTNIVDMEKDIYYPVYDYETCKDSGCMHLSYEPIRCVRFNLHFRTRDLETWKVMEDYVEDENDKTNWFVTDYEYYKNVLDPRFENPNTYTLHNASDLIGYMNFTTSEAKNRAKKIGKSFLRLSFYSTPNPKTQVLLGTSTIFMDDALLCKKVISLQKSANAGDFIQTQRYVYTASSVSYMTDHVTADSERGDLISMIDFAKTEDVRLSSRFNVYDKHISDTSSEGFYFYMYREYADNMRQKTIYLKVEFNHAGIGKTIPFMLPRKFEENDDIGNPLYIHKKDDLEILKQGFTLRDIYKQIYIPINVIFDDKTNEYVYFLPEKLRENSELKVDDDIMEFNLFEIKFKDESQEPERNESNQ